MTGCDGEPTRTATDEGGLAGAAFDALPAQVAVVDAEGVIRETNRAWRQFGLDNDLRGDADMIGESYLAVCDAADDDSAQAAAAGIRSVLAGERAEFSLEYPCHSPDERRWFLMRAIALSERDEPHALVMHVDITDRKEAELRVAGNNETLSTVMGVLSHDLRNPLNVAMGRAELLANDPAVGPEAVAEQTESIRSSLERMNAIVDDALVLANGSKGIDAERVKLGAIARDAWSHVETDEVSLEIAEDGPLVADASLLTQLLENLFRNAVEHGSTSSQTRSDDAVDHADGVETITVGITDRGFYVADDGRGIAPENRERVFDTGYSTDRTGGNTGMGLAIVRKIADAHDWSVTLTDAGDRSASDRPGVRFAFDGATLDQ